MIRVPAHLLPFSVHDGELVPRLLTEADHPWLRDLLDDFDASVGQTRRALRARLATRGAREADPRAPAGRRELAIHVVSRLFGTEVRAAVPPATARSHTFRAAAAGADRDAAVARAARALGTVPAQLRGALFADLPDQRVVRLVEHPVDPHRVALTCNLALLQSLLRRAVDVDLSIDGHARAILRIIKLRGLIATVLGDVARAPRLRLSGPLSLLRCTTRYGNALAALLSHLPWCRRYALRARVLPPGAGRESTPLLLRLRSGDPILPAPQPARFDSLLEGRFARDFSRIAPDWELVREPRPVRAGPGLVFPDFEIRHRRDRRRRHLCEIVGFWTPEYLRRKLARLHAARLHDLLLCVDRKRDCGNGSGSPPLTVPAGARVVWFDRRIDAREVVALVEAGRGTA